MNQQTPPSNPGSEILSRTRTIDATTTKLLPLLELLWKDEVPSPLEALRETLIEILLAQRQTGTRLARIELHLQNLQTPSGPNAAGGASKN
jgi:hypothetical protein